MPPQQCKKISKCFQNILSANQCYFTCMNTLVIARFLSFGLEKCLVSLLGSFGFSTLPSQTIVSSDSFPSLFFWELQKFSPSNSETATSMLPFFFGLLLPRLVDNCLLHKSIWIFNYEWVHSLSTENHEILNT